MVDWRDVETVGIGEFGNPAALGRVVGEVENFDEDLVVGKWRKLCGYFFEGGIRRGENREVCGFVLENPLVGGSWDRHHNVLAV